MVNALGLALKWALYDYMLGHLLDENVRVWFAEFVDRVPKPTAERQSITKALARLS